MGSQKVSQSQFIELEKVISYLEDLAASFKEGKIVVTKGEECVVLNPPEQVNVEVSAKSKKGKSKFSLELSWKEMGLPEGEPEVAITAQEPEPVEEEPEEEEEALEDEAPEEEESEGEEEVSEEEQET